MNYLCTFFDTFEVTMSKGDGVELLRRTFEDTVDVIFTNTSLGTGWNLKMGNLHLGKSKNSIEPYLT